MKSAVRFIFTTSLALAGLFGAATRADAVTNLVTNGDFENRLVGWSIGPAAFTPLLDTTSKFEQDHPGTCTGGCYPPLWTVNDSPNGGRFVAADGGAPFRSDFYQTINGLEVGAKYDLTFEYAGSQQVSFTGATDQNYDVRFGSESFSTPIMHVPSQGFVGWLTGAHTFTATATSQVLTFLAVGTPSVPPWLLLDNVVLTKQFTPPTDAPGPLPLMGLGCAAAWSRRLRRRVLSAGSSRTV